MSLDVTLPGADDTSNHSQLPISGYLDRLSAFPGESLDAFVSIQCNDDNFDISLERVICADPNPAGPGMQFESFGPSTACKGRHQPIHIGSYGVLPVETPTPSACRTWSLMFLVKAPVEHRSTLFSDEADSGCFTVSLDPKGIVVEIGDKEYSLSEHVEHETWYKLLVSVDLQHKKLHIRLGALEKNISSVDHELQQEVAAFPSSSKLTLAARDAKHPTAHFTGKIESPNLIDIFLSDWPDTGDLNKSLIAAWDFSIGIEGNTVYDTGPKKLNGKLYNQPARGSKGSLWNGKEHQWRYAPKHYAAIHFHDDDLDDCRWERTFSYTVPNNLKSGIYALKLTAGSAREWLPFYVRPKADTPKQPILFLVSTFTYVAYANGRLSNGFLFAQRRNKNWSDTEYASKLYPTYGCSTYDRHRDGSGVSFASRLRPMLTMRPGFVSLWDQFGSGVRHYVADSHLTAWMEAKGMGFDVVTDEDLHREGSAALAGYKTVVTGTHPEYHTRETLDALGEYTARGGNLAYMGGNGFYWKIGYDETRPHLIEMRRAEGGIRTWAAEAGEYYNALDGELGGLWSRNNRIPNHLVGVGFSTQGPFASGHFKRSEASYAEDVAWVFGGVKGIEFGNYGLSGGGAAGFELDRAELKFGSPGETVVLATSLDLPEGYTPCHEEMLTEEWTVSGTAPEDMVRGDITLSKVRGGKGGMVFATGSIAFCGSLWNGEAWEGDVSRLLENVLTRFTK
jgi:N,N-dimethylformamidase